MRSWCDPHCDQIGFASSPGPANCLEEVIGHEMLFGVEDGDRRCIDGIQFDPPAPAVLPSAIDRRHPHGSKLVQRPFLLRRSSQTAQEPWPVAKTRRRQGEGPLERTSFWRDELSQGPPEQNFPWHNRKAPPPRQGTKVTDDLQGSQSDVEGSQHEQYVPAALALLAPDQLENEEDAEQPNENGLSEQNPAERPFGSAHCVLSRFHALKLHAHLQDSRAWSR